MRFALSLAAVLLAGPALAQSPPLTRDTPSPETTRERPLDRPEATTGSVAADPNARNRPDGRVAAPAAINTPVQVIAPEKK